MPCELCDAVAALTSWPLPGGPPGAAVELCGNCRAALAAPASGNAHHWQALHGAIWNEKPAVRVLSHHILRGLASSPWAMDLLEQLSLSPEEHAWAAHLAPATEATDLGHLTMDAHGAPLAEGDSVTLIKDLEVKGGGFTAKRGTLVRQIRLTENPEHVEGRVNGVLIVLVAKYLKKA